MMAKQQLSDFSKILSYFVHKIVLTACRLIKLKSHWTFICNLLYFLTKRQLFYLLYQDNLKSKKIGFSLKKEQQRQVNLLCSSEETILKVQQYLSKKVKMGGFSLHYKLQKFIGQGQSAKVWTVNRISDSKKFAVKIFNKREIHGQVNGIELLHNQMQILGRLQHKSLNKLQAVYESDLKIYLVVQLIQGKTLTEFINERIKLNQKQHEKQNVSYSYQSKINIGQNKKIMKQLLESIAYLHRKNIAHRDSKLDNLLINKRLQPAVIDFGLSEQVDKQEYLLSFCGSPGFIAPQLIQNQNSEMIDYKKADIFSLGVVFYKLLVLEGLFWGQNTEQILQNTTKCSQIVQQKLDNSNLEQDQIDLLHKMLEKDPVDRITAEQALKHRCFNKINNKIKVSQKKVLTTKQSLPLKLRNVNSKFQELFSEVLTHERQDNGQQNIKGNTISENLISKQIIHERSAQIQHPSMKLSHFIDYQPLQNIKKLNSAFYSRQDDLL